MTYEELTRDIASRSISQLPGILQRVVRTCSIKPVFVDKEAMLRFVSRAWDMGAVGDAELRGQYVDNISRNETTQETKSADSLAKGAGTDFAKEPGSI